MQCLPCHIQYQVIARLETLERDSAYILQSIGVTTRLPVSHTTQGNTSNTLVTSYYSQINNNLLDKLYSLYKYDFLLFNFTHTYYADIVQDTWATVMYYVKWINKTFYWSSLDFLHSNFHYTGNSLSLDKKNCLILYSWSKSNLHWDQNPWIYLLW